MAPEARPSVSVVVPFHGDRSQAVGALAAVGRLALAEGDEVLLADNTTSGVLSRLAAERPRSSADRRVRVVRATGERSSYHARNVGARATGGEWILLLDADCVPAPDLIEAYFAEPVRERCAILAGEIAGDGGQHGLLPRYARSRNYLSQTEGLHGKSGSAAATANLLVRRSAFEQVGGFAEGIRSGGDVDLCWRLLTVGWTLEHRPAAAVVHRHRETLPGFLSQIARYAAGARWLDARRPGASPRWPLVPGLIGSARDIGSNLARGRLEEATFRAIDGLGLVAHNVGYRASNRC